VRARLGVTAQAGHLGQVKLEALLQPVHLHARNMDEEMNATKNVRMLHAKRNESSALRARTAGPESKVSTCASGGV
jgi:hypothetical protein